MQEMRFATTRRQFVLAASALISAACSGYQKIPDLDFIQGDVLGAPRAARIRAAYMFAGTHPNVLADIHCWCGCEQLGHKSAADCFVAARGMFGGVTWATHGASCDVCVDIVIEAKTLYEAGVAQAEIADRIREAYVKGQL